MKGLSNNSKLFATFFLLACLTANTSWLQTNIYTGSASFASGSMDIETDSVLPSEIHNCEEIKNSYTSKDFSVEEGQIVNFEHFDDEEDEDDFIDDGFDRPRSIKRYAPKGKISFKVNYKKYICNKGRLNESTQIGYEIGTTDSTNGQLEAENCPKCEHTSGSIISKATDSFRDIANRILKDGMKATIQAQYDIAQKNKAKKLAVEMCEGIIDEETGQLIRYSNSDKGVQLKNDCLVRKISSSNNTKKISQLYSLIEDEIHALANSDNIEDRQEAIDMINKMLKIRERKNRSGKMQEVKHRTLKRSGKNLPADIRTELKNLRNFAKGSNTVDKFDTLFNDNIANLKKQSCDVKEPPACLSDHLINTRIKTLKLMRDKQLLANKYQDLNPTKWFTSEDDDGQDSYKNWSKSLEQYYDATINQINDIYRGPITATNGGNGQPTITNGSNYNNRFDYLLSQEVQNLRSQTQKGSTIFGKRDTTTPVPQSLRN